jgi:hypothetical protein
MRSVLVFLLLLIVPLRPGSAATNDLVLPSVDFSATAVQESGAMLQKQTIHYASGKLRIDPGKGFSITILDLTTQSQYLLMANHTYLVLPMDSELFRRFIARPVAMTGATKIKTERVANLNTTKYAFGDDGALKAAGHYWLSDNGIMVRRDYEDGVYGHNVRHHEYLLDLSFTKQPAALFEIPPGYKRVQ